MGTRLSNPSAAPPSLAPACPGAARWRAWRDAPGGSGFAARPRKAAEPALGLSGEQFTFGDALGATGPLQPPLRFVLQRAAQPGRVEIRRAAGRAWLEGAARGSRAPAPGGAGGFLGAEPPSPGARVPAAPAPRPRESARQAAAFPGLFPRLSPSRPARGLQLLPCPGAAPGPAAAPIPGAPAAAPFPRSPLPAARSFLPPLPPVQGGLPRPRGPPLPAIARFPSAPVTHGPRPRSARPRCVLFPTPPRPFSRLPPAPVPSPARCQPPRWPAVPSLGRVHFIPTLIPRIPHFLLSNSRGNKNPPFSSQTPARPRPPRPPPRRHPGSPSRRPLRAPQVSARFVPLRPPAPAAPPLRSPPLPGHPAGGSARAGIVRAVPAAAGPGEGGAPGAAPRAAAAPRQLFPVSPTWRRRCGARG